MQPNPSTVTAPSGALEQEGQRPVLERSRKGGIELPDPAREVVFPKGVPIVHMESAQKSNLTSEGQTGATSPEEETAAATIGEGNLSNEVTEVRERSKGNVPEASENLLKG